MLTRAFQIVSALCLVSSGVLAQSIITAPDLQHHRWVLETISLDANKSLILRTAESTLLFRLKDWVAAAK